MLAVIDWKKPPTLHHMDSFVREGADGVRPSPLAEVAGVGMLKSNSSANITKKNKFMQRIKMPDLAALTREHHPGTCGLANHFLSAAEQGRSQSLEISTSARRDLALPTATGNYRKPSRYNFHVQRRSDFVASSGCLARPSGNLAHSQSRCAICIVRRLLRSIDLA